MVDYYYSDGKETFGPFSIDELKNKNLSPQTLIWHEQLKGWAQLADLPEIGSHVSLKTPPPPPPARLPKHGNTNDSFRSMYGRTVYLRDEEVIISKRVIKWLMIWILFHMVALFTSYKEIPFFNVSGEPKPQNFWPFVNFIDEYYVKNSNNEADLWQTKLRFNGLFVNYDWTEFGSYVGGLLLLLLFYYLYKKAD